MNTFTRLFLIFLLPVAIPVAILIIINESSRNSITKQPFMRHGIIAINTSKAIKNKCSWECHNNTQYCIANHAKFLQSNKKVNFAYFGMIRALKSYGNYAVANIIFLVILWPLLMYFLLIKSLLLSNSIAKIKKKNGTQYVE